MISAAALIAALLLAFGGLYDFDAAYGYFSAGSICAIGLYCVLAASAVIGIFNWITERKTCCADRSLPHMKAETVISVFCGTAILISVFMDVIGHMNSAPAEYAIVSYLSWGFGVIAAASLFSTAVMGNREPSSLPCLLAFSPTLFFAAKVLVHYFDRSIAVNSPVTILCQVTFIAFALISTAEAGIMLGRGYLYSRYIFTLCTSAALGIGVGLGSLILYFYGVQFPVSIDTSIIFVLFGIYSLIRLFAIKSYSVISAEEFEAALKEKDDNESKEENEEE